MTLTQLTAADLDAQLPGLLVEASVVALVPATDLRGWAAEMAWNVARAAAAAGRRTALVDCFADAPTLHTVAGAVNDEGIVDAFEYGASLNRIVQQQPQANLYFIPTGTFAADSEQLMHNPRWKRLSAGFRHERALLLIYVGAEHLAGLAAEPDGIVVLAPQGLDLAVGDAPALTEAIGRGMPLLAVVADPAARRSAELRALELADESGIGDQGSGAGERAPAQPAAEAPRRRPSAPMAMLLEGQQRPNWLLRVGIIIGLGLVAAMVWLAVTRARGPAVTVARATDSAGAPQPPLPALPAAESLPFAVQIASRPGLPEALQLADTLEAHGSATMIAPVRLPRRPAMFLVYAGPFADSAHADSALAALRTRGALAANAGARANLPLSVALSDGLTLDNARAERLRLRSAGVPAFILGVGDGTFRLYAGAYDATAQAVLLQDLLTPTGSAGTFVPRAGYVP